MKITWYLLQVFIYEKQSESILIKEERFSCEVYLIKIVGDVLFLQKKN